MEGSNITPALKQKFQDENNVSFEYSELDEELDGVAFKETQSSSTCKVNDIESFMFGALSSRFWMLRKFINNLEKNELDKMPFYSWNCLTLSLKHRDVDLVIKDEKDMEYILKFLIMKLKTVDGMRGSALPLIEALNAQTRKEK